MKKVSLVSLCAALSLLSASLYAEDSAPKLKVYGFIRNYYAFDSRESLAGTEDLFYYVPKDISLNDENVDINANPNFKFAALTSRLGVDVKGYEYKGWDFAAKIEADFYNGLSKTEDDKLTKSSLTGTANLRLRQAYVTMSNYRWTFKAGQAWHPLAADMPHIFSLNTGAPFGPFSRTPVAQFDASFGKHFGLTAAAIWEMQYCSAGPEGASANYMKYGCTPEFYFGVNVNAGGFLGRLGLDVHSIKPRITGTTVRTVDGFTQDVHVKVSDRITTISPFFYAQYKTKFGKVPFSVKAKTVYAQAGEHVNLNGGYAVSSVNEDGSWNYTPTRNSSTWVSLSVGSRFQGVLFGGYVKNFGTKDDILSTEALYFSKNSFKNMNQMWRLTPAFMYNLGKFTVGLEYEVTSVQYGDFDDTLVGGFPQSDDCRKGLATENLHWVTNHRVQAMVKFTF